MGSNLDAYRKYKAPTSAGQYLKLADGGEAKVRIVSDCYTYMDSYNGGPEKPRYAWVIWNFTEQRAQVWQAGVKVFEEVQKYALDEEWGDPVGYNFTVKRETENNFTSFPITPSPNKFDIKSQLTHEQLEELVAFDIYKVLKMGKDQLISIAAAADGEEPEMTTPATERTTDNLPTDDDLKKNLNLDDIPF